MCGLYNSNQFLLTSQEQQSEVRTKRRDVPNVKKIKDAASKVKNNYQINLLMHSFKITTTVSVIITSTINLLIVLGQTCLILLFGISYFILLEKHQHCSHLWTLVSTSQIIKYNLIWRLCQELSQITGSLTIKRELRNTCEFLLHSFLIRIWTNNYLMHKTVLENLTFTQMYYFYFCC